MQCRGNASQTPRPVTALAGNFECFALGLPDLEPRAVSRGRSALHDVDGRRRSGWCDCWGGLCSQSGPVRLDTIARGLQQRLDVLRRSPIWPGEQRLEPAPEGIVACSLEDVGKLRTQSVQACIAQHGERARDERVAHRLRLASGLAKHQDMRRLYADIDLLAHVAEQVLEFRARRGGQDVETEHATVGVEFSRFGPGFSRSNVDRQRVGHLHDQVERILALVEAFRFRLVAHARELCLALRDPVPGIQSHLVRLHGERLAQSRWKTSRYRCGLSRDGGVRLSRVVSTGKVMTHLGRELVRARLHALGFASVALDRIGDAAHHVRAREQQVRHLRDEIDLPLADRIEQVLAGVQHVGEIAEFEQSGIALQSVDETEDLVDHRRVTRGSFQVEQLVRNLLEAIARLEDELLQERVHATSIPSIARTYALRRDAGLGLTM